MNPLNSQDFTKNFTTIGNGKNDVIHAIAIGRPNVSLREWRTFNAVVTCGGYASAAKYLHVTQPAVSYTIAKLEELLRMRLLKLDGRKVQLTEHGKEIFERSRILIHSAMELENFVEDVRKNRRPQLRIAVDPAFPSNVIARALRKWSNFAPQTSVQLIETMGSEIEALLQDRAADLAISGQLASGCEGEPLVEIEYIAVAHPSHPLCRLERKITQADLDQETQVIPDAGSAPYFNQHISNAGNVNSANGANGAAKQPIWIVRSIDAAEAVLKEGLCFGWLPKHRVQSALDAGELQALSMQTARTRTYKFYLIYGHRWFPDHEKAHIEEIFREAASKIYLRENVGHTRASH